MKRVMVIEGQVNPEHRITDLGVVVPFGKTVTIPYEKAKWSRDLADALRQGAVLKKQVITVKTGTQRRYERRRGREQARRQERGITPFGGGAVATKEGHLEEGKDVGGERLRRMNEELVRNTNKVIKQQEVLIRKITEYMEEPRQYIYVRPQGEGGQPQEERDRPEARVKESVPTYVPSKIRRESVEAPKSAVATQEVGEGGNLSAATEALKQMRGRKDEN